MALFVVYAARRSVAKQFAGPFSLASCSGRAVRTGDAHLDTRLGSLRWFYAGHRRVGTAFLSAIATPRSTRRSILTYRDRQLAAGRIRSVSSLSVMGAGVPLNYSERDSLTTPSQAPNRCPPMELRARIADRHFLKSISGDPESFGHGLEAR
jgi:hypothetical protein